MSLVPIVLVRALETKSDERGESFHLPPDALVFLGSVKEVHYATLEPGKVRGNHVHMTREEAIIVTYHDRWRLAWMATAQGSIDIRDFAGSGSVVLDVPRAIPHAIKNLGNSTLAIVSLLNGTFDPQSPDTQVIPILSGD